MSGFMEAGTMHSAIYGSRRPYDWLFLQRLLWTFQPWLQTKKLTDYRAHLHASVQFLCTITRLLCTHWNRMPYTCYLLPSHVIYYKCVAQIVETII